MKKGFLIALIAIVGFLVLTAESCEKESTTSITGVQKAVAEVEVQASGMTVEQENIKRKLEAENLPGAVKHLYLISAYSGQVILYSTVKGKVTSSGKRLSPYSVSDNDHSGCYDGFKINISDRAYITSEVLQDDGTYGSSIPYLYWWDVQDRYHQHYVSGGQIVHVTDVPLSGIKSVIISVEQQ